MSISTEIHVWIGVALTFCIFSFLYKENPFYRFAESLFIGVSSGYFFSVWILNVLKPRLYDPLINGDFSLLVPLALGSLIFLRYTNNYKKIAKIPVLIFIAAFAGINMVYYVKSFVLSQVTASISGLIAYNADGTINPVATVNSILLLLGVISVSCYFHYSRKERSTVYYAGSVGRVYLMVAFGAVFGYTIMARISLLIGRIQFIFGDWLGFID